MQSHCVRFCILFTVVHIWRLIVRQWMCFKVAYYYLWRGYLNNRVQSEYIFVIYSVNIMTVFTSIHFCRVHILATCFRGNSTKPIVNSAMFFRSVGFRKRIVHTNSLYAGLNNILLYICAKTVILSVFS